MRLFAAALVAFASGCAGNMEITRTFAPSEAARVRTDTFEPVALLRDGSRIDVPRGARIERTRIVVSGSTELVHKLTADDVIETDDAARIVAVRSPLDIVRFVPGTATSASDSDEVRGTLATGEQNAIQLQEHDLIEMHGTFAPGDALPGGGRVESSRATGALVAGIALFTLSYAPVAYLASQSPSPWDRSLFIPFAGPWMDLASRPACVPPAVPAGYSLPIDPCIGETIARVALVTSGALQGLGAVFAIFGLPAHSRIEGSADRTTARTTPSKIHVSFVPTGMGAAAFGTF